jgi:ADP-ribose pyrophosphatase YjhB (NUDIX family)
MKDKYINMEYDELVNNLLNMNEDEIISISKEIGYPVFNRLCMGKLKHKSILLQDGAAAIILNDKNEILLQCRKDNNLWGLPGGCQELGEALEETIIREVKEETNLDVRIDDIKLISVVSGNSRKNKYPNGDIVINNTVLYLIDKYDGILKFDSESKDMKYFSIDSLPDELNDPDLIDRYMYYISK